MKENPGMWERIVMFGIKAMLVLALVWIVEANNAQDFSFDEHCRIIEIVAGIVFGVEGAMKLLKMGADKMRSSDEEDQ